jgi:hypothetical protein
MSDIPNVSPPGTLNRVEIGRNIRDIAILILAQTPVVIEQVDKMDWGQHTHLVTLGTGIALVVLNRLFNVSRINN